MTEFPSTAVSFVRKAYELGALRSTGTLRAIAERGRAEDIEIVDGAVPVPSDDPLGRRTASHLSSLAVLEPATSFCRAKDGTPRRVTALRSVSLLAWARRHVEWVLDVPRAENLAQRLRASQVRLRRGFEVHPVCLDAADRRILSALAKIGDLRGLSAVARLPRFRILAFIDFLDTIGALAPAPLRSRCCTRSDRVAALRLLGLPADASADGVKSAFRRLAKTLHPDLHPTAPDAHKQELSRRLAGVTVAYAALTGGG